MTFRFGRLVEFLTPVPHSVLYWFVREKIVIFASLASLKIKANYRSQKMTSSPKEDGGMEVVRLTEKNAAIRLTRIQRKS